MPIFLQLVWYFSQWMLNGQDILVEHKYDKQISASSIADYIELVTLDKFCFNIRHLSIGESYFFISPGEKDFKGFSKSVARFSKQGKFLGEIYRSDNLIVGLAYNSDKDQLYIGHTQAVVIFDVQQGKHVAEIKTEGLSNLMYSDDNIFITRTGSGGDSKQYLVEKYNTGNLSRKVTCLDLKVIADSPMAKSIFRSGSFSNGKSDLYVSTGETDEIFSSSNDFTKPVVRFRNLHQGNGQAFDILFSTNQGVIGRFATTSFRLKGKKFLLFYDLINKKQFLSEATDTSGVYDDFNNSGNYVPRFTDSSLYMYSSKNQNEKQTTIALFKIKS